MENKKNEYESTIHSLIVKLKNEPIHSESATIIMLEDDGAGPFVVVRQYTDTSNAEIRLMSEEWPAISKSISRLLEESDRQTKNLLDDEEK